MDSGLLFLGLIGAFVVAGLVFARRQKSERRYLPDTFDAPRAPPPRRRLEPKAELPPKAIARNVRVAGLRHHGAAFAAWTDAVAKAKDEGVEYGLELQWEPENPYDENAHKVIGWARTAGIESHHIGYVPADLADMLVEIKGGRYPLKAVILWVGKSEVAFEIRSSIDAPDLGEWRPEAHL